MKTTNFIPLDIATARIVAVAQTENYEVYAIRLTHDDLPGMRWFDVNSRKTGFVSRYTKKAEDLRADCYCVQANPQHDIYVVAARYAQLDSWLSRGLINEAEHARIELRIQQTSGMTRSYAKRYQEKYA